MVNAPTTARLPAEVLQSALASANVGVWTWAPESDALELTPACLWLLGLRPEDFDGTLAGALLHVRHEDALALRALLEATALGGPRPRYEFRVEREGHASRWVQAVANTAPEDASAAAVVGTLLDVNERKQHLATALERERSMRSLADNCPYVIARFDRDLRHVFVNSAIEPVTGMPAEAFIGKTNRELGMPEALCDQWDVCFRGVLESGQPATLDFEFPGTDGPRTFSNRVVAERDVEGLVHGLLVVGHEITTVKRATERLRQSEARLERAQRAAAVGTWDWHIQTGEASWTDEAYRLFGHSPGIPVTFDLWLQSVHRDDRDRVADEVQQATAAGEAYHSQYRVLVEGRCRWVEVHGEVDRDGEGVPVRMLGTVRDVSEARQVEQDLREAARSREQLLAFVSHDLRSPLQTVSTGIQALEAWTGRGAPAEGRVRAETMLTLMARQTTQMRNLVDELVEAAKTRQSLPLQLERTKTDLVTLAHRLAQEHASVEVSATPARLVGHFDVSTLERILNNLLSNAIKYSAEGSPVRLELASVERDGRHWAVLEVQDRGIGIPADEQGAVFDWFRRASNARNSPTPGTGIGLASVRELVSQHGGTITVASEEGVGTTVTVTLPIEPAADSGS